MQRLAVVMQTIPPEEEQWKGRSAMSPLAIQSVAQVGIALAGIGAKPVISDFDETKVRSLAASKA